MKKGESFKEYEDRCQNYLKKMNDADFYKLMGELDPMNSELEYLTELMTKIDAKKSKKCTIF